MNERIYKKFAKFLYFLEKNTKTIRRKKQTVFLEELFTEGKIYMEIILMENVIE